jgi:hypothetical protein
MVLVKYSGNSRLHQLNGLRIADSRGYDKYLTFETRGTRALHEIESSLGSEINVEKDNVRLRRRENGQTFRRGTNLAGNGKPWLTIEHSRQTFAEHRVVIDKEEPDIFDNNGIHFVNAN